MAAERPSLILLILLVVLVLIAAGVGAAFVYEYNKPKAAPTLLTVQKGDNVTVNYIGEFGSGPQIGRVFDTSFYSVAQNNVTYPKSLEYAPRSSASAYTPLAVHVGPNAPAGGYPVGNLTFSGVVTGFWQGLVGLTGNHTQTVVVPASLGYGPLNSSCLRPAPLVFTLPVLTYLPLGEFASLYPNVTADVGVEFTDSNYGWTDQVFAVNATSVSVQALPTVGQTSSPDGLPFEVTALNATSVTLSSLLTPANAGLVLGHLRVGSICSESKFIVSAVDPSAGTLTENFNPEVQGETLDFIVAVVNIYPA